HLRFSLRASLTSQTSQSVLVLYLFSVQIKGGGCCMAGFTYKAQTTPGWRHGNVRLTRMHKQSTVPLFFNLSRDQVWIGLSLGSDLESDFEKKEATDNRSRIDGEELCAAPATSLDYLALSAY